MTGRLAVFGYGSLVSRESAGVTLGREVESVTPARLRGHARSWTLGRDNLRSEKTFARPDGSVPRFCLGLNLELDPDAPPPNGALIEVTEAELRRLDLREMRYERIEVTDLVILEQAIGGELERVFTYRARGEHHHPSPPGDAILIGNYVRAVESGFASLGAGQLDLYRRTTRPATVEIADATLIGDRIPEGNPRDW
jgi:cation transport regulator ChaC